MFNPKNNRDLDMKDLEEKADKHKDRLAAFRTFLISF
jgi:hypothetical protein